MLYDDILRRRKNSRNHERVTIEEKQDENILVNKEEPAQTEANNSSSSNIESPDPININLPRTTFNPEFQRNKSSEIKELSEKDDENQSVQRQLIETAAPSTPRGLDKRINISERVMTRRQRQIRFRWYLAYTIYQNCYLHEKRKPALSRSGGQQLIPPIERVYLMQAWRVEREMEIRKQKPFSSVHDSTPPNSSTPAQKSTTSPSFPSIIVPMQSRSNDNQPNTTNEKQRKHDQ